MGESRPRKTRRKSLLEQNLERVLNEEYPGENGIPTKNDEDLEGERDVKCV